MIPSASVKPSSQDGRLAETFGAPVADLYERAAVPGAAALTRALELRGFLAVAEEQVARVRDRVHEAMAPGRDMDELSAGDLRSDAQWLAAALDARDGYLTALGELLRTMPAQSEERSARPVEFAQPQITTTLPPTAAPAPPRAGAPPGPRP
ncbi:hypothetical protein [Streptomyces sp. IB2014 016-6]|uniref:hypothetical protein n=1 Tax=Streptomyces sp. IB2014 016-6 TaxID=2517818 RepID=UPI001F4F60F4|nr:hypothetical protein [Streptomyces sp. IB2014 016-6]